MIPVNAPQIANESKALVMQALNEGWISSAGPYVEDFEREFADFVGVGYAIAVSSGTAALHVALLTMGIGVGDEVILPSYTMAATWMAVMYTGATPIFVDVEPDIFTLNPDLLMSILSPRTKAIIPVHIYGHPAEMDKIMAFAKAHSLYVIEDAAEAHGARYRGQLVGGIGDINAFSFYANKIITTGEGGMITTNDSDLADKARKLRDLSHSQTRFIHDQLGYNYRLTSLQAALGLGQLRAIDTWLLHKKHLAEMYGKGLSHIRGLTLPVTRSWATNVYWMYAVLVDPMVLGMSKNELRQKLLQSGVDTRDFFYPPRVQPALTTAHVPLGDYPVTEAIAENGFYLPSGLALTDQQISEVCETIDRICTKRD